MKTDIIGHRSSDRERLNPRTFWQSSPPLFSLL